MMGKRKLAMTGVRLPLGCLKAAAKHAHHKNRRNNEIKKNEGFYPY